MNIVALLLPLLSKKKDCKEDHVESESLQNEQRMSKIKPEEGFIEEELNHMSDINGKASLKSIQWTLIQLFYCTNIQRKF